MSRTILASGPRRTVKRWCAWCGETLRSGKFCNDDCAGAYSADVGITQPPLKRGPLPPSPSSPR